jgi:apolipoprotein D and lipocalin family protein
MSRLMVLAVALLAACAPSPNRGAFRAADAPIYSGKAVFDSKSTGLAAQSNLCIAGRVQDLSGPVTPVGPGRFSIGDAEPWWVLWIDADARTMAIGTPSGAFGFILNRVGPIPADRLAAAKDILAFNGYDPGRLSDY